MQNWFKTLSSCVEINKLQIVFIIFKDSKLYSYNRYNSFQSDSTIIDRYRDTMVETHTEINIFREINTSIQQF